MERYRRAIISFYPILDARPIKNFYTSGLKFRLLSFWKIFQKRDADIVKVKGNRAEEREIKSLWEKWKQKEELEQRGD